MIRTLVAHTREIDDVDLAVQEILAQLDLAANLLSSSAGMIECDSEFIESGVVAALSKALPFDVIGTTTLALAVAGQVGQFMLSLTVLTGDDVKFSTAVTASMNEELEGPMRRAYGDAFKGLGGEKARMMLVVAPLLMQYPGDLYVELLDGITGCLPCFGTVIVDNSLNYQNSRTLYNGAAYPDAMAMMLIAGNIEPSFHVASLADDCEKMEEALITKSEGNALIEVNGMPLMNYLEYLGLAENGVSKPIVESLPFVLDLGDGTPIGRALIFMNQQGQGIFGGKMPSGARLSAGSWNKEDVLATTRHAAALALEKARQGMIMFSCIGRNMALGIDNMAELETVETMVSGKAPFAFCYSGGEICPVKTDEKLTNRYHNNTFVVCSF